MKKKDEGYVVGVSSGMFKMAAQNEKSQFLTIPRKIFRGGLEGVSFTQLDLESVTEFNEPFLKKEVEKIKKLGIRFGAHGEAAAMRSGENPIGQLDSSLDTNYKHSHERLILHIEGLGSKDGIGSEYVNIHPSETIHFLRLPLSLQPTKLVDPWGRPFKKFFEDYPYLREWIANEAKEFIWEFTRRTYDYLLSVQHDDARRRYARSNNKEKISSEEDMKLHEEAKESVINYFLEQIDTSEMSYGAERVAYFLVAKMMKQENHPLWRDIVGKDIPDKDFDKRHEEWVPAVSSMYILGHFRPKDSKSPVELLKKNNLVFCFESEMGMGGLEGKNRLTKPIDMIHLCKAIDSEYVGITIDIEHVLSQNMDPVKEAEKIKNGLGKYVKVLHIGFPTPHTPAHEALDLGSREQEYIYKIAWSLRQVGFRKGYLIFERGSNPRGTSLLAIKKIKEFLEKDVSPDELTPDFYGMDKNDFRLSKQKVTIREHALDPIKGLLGVPEEDHTFLSSEAVRKGKGEEWRRRRYR